MRLLQLVARTLRLAVMLHCNIRGSTSTISAPAFTQEASPERSFTREGITYVYTATKVGDTTVLAGRASPVGGPFKLTVRGKQVNGRAGGVPVSFAVDRPLVRSATTLAAR
jgi:hypothetical protein